MNDLKKVGIISVMVDSMVDRSELQSKSILGSILNGKKSKFDMQVVSENLKKLIFDNFSSSFSFEIEDEDNIINNEEYKKLKNPLSSIGINTKQPEGYLKLTDSDAKESKIILKSIPNIDGVMYIRAGYKIEKKTKKFFGGGTAIVDAYINITVRNKEFKGALSLTGIGKSTSVLKYSGNNDIDTSNFIDACNEANEKALENIITKMKN